MDTKRRSKRLKKNDKSPDIVYNLRKGPKAKKDLCCKQAKIQTNKKPKEGKSSLLGNLPSEIILQILGYLPLKTLATASTVCKAWRDFCNHKSLWKTVAFEGSDVNKMPVALWGKLNKLGTTCLDFHEDRTFPKISMATRFTNSALASISKLKKVTNLYFGGIGKEDLSAITRNMPQLKILHVTCLLPQNTYCKCFYYDVGSLCVLTYLEELMLNSLFIVTMPTFAFSGGMNSLVGLQKLKKLILSNIDVIAYENLMFLKDLPHLEHLELGNCSDRLFEDYMDKKYEALTGLEKLKTLSLTHAHCTCPDYCSCLLPFLTSLKSLTKLSLLMCTVPKRLNHALVQLKSLRSVEIWPYLDSFLHSMSRTMDKDMITESYVEIFHGMDHLQSATIGVLDVNVLASREPVRSWSESDSSGSSSDEDSDDNDSDGIDSDEGGDDDDSDGIDSDEGGNDGDSSGTSDDEGSDEDNTDENEGDELSRIAVGDAQEDNAHQSHNRNEDTATGNQSPGTSEGKVGAESGAKVAIEQTLRKASDEVLSNEDIATNSESVDCVGGPSNENIGGEEVHDIDTVEDEGKHEHIESVNTNASQNVDKEDRLCDGNNIAGAGREVDTASPTSPKHDESAPSSSLLVAANEDNQDSSDDDSLFDEYDTSNRQLGEKKWTKFFELVKQKVFKILPKTRLTLYRVSESQSDVVVKTDMFYISRIEERYTKLDI